jgi:hypothetical protein
MDRLEDICKRMKRKTRGGCTHEEFLDAAFRTFDANHSGELDFEEFHDALRNLVGDLRVIDAKLFFKAIDLDDGGTISISEFRDRAYRPATYRERVATLLEQDPEQRRFVEVLQTLLEAAGSNGIHDEVGYGEGRGGDGDFDDGGFSGDEDGDFDWDPERARADFGASTRPQTAGAGRSDRRGGVRDGARSAGNSTRRELSGTGARRPGGATGTATARRPAAPVVNPGETLKRFKSEVARKSRKIKAHVPRWERLSLPRTKLLHRQATRFLLERFQVKCVTRLRSRWSHSHLLRTHSFARSLTRPLAHSLAHSLGQVHSRSVARALTRRRRTMRHPNPQFTHSAITAGARHHGRRHRPAGGRAAGARLLRGERPSS